MDFARSRVIMESPLQTTADDEARHKARVAGIKLLIGGMLAPVGYVFASMQTYGHLKTLPAIIAFSVSLVCVVLGARAVIITRR